ncbi:hypothetical protein BJ742DRAFT_779928 [Cladochytrium replicatum]|nr:hypothetical protein BJ742DRAFT_779928 [Cladochytrium replicatum]
MEDDSSVKVTVRDLAVTDGKAKQGRSWQGVPLIAPLTAVFILTILGICLPLGLVLSLTSSQSVSEISARSLLLIDSHVRTSVREIMGITFATAMLLTKDTKLRKVLRSNFDKLIDEVDSLHLLVNAQLMSPYTTTLSCVSSPNVTGTLNLQALNADPPNVTLVGAYSIPAFLDRSTNKSIVYYNFTADGSALDKVQFAVGLPGSNLSQYDDYRALVTKPYNTEPFWYSVYFPIQGADGENRLPWLYVVTSPVFASSTDAAAGAMPLYSCAVALEVQEGFSKGIAGVRATISNGTRIGVFERKTGIFVTADRGSTVAQGPEKYTATSTTDVTMSSIMKALMQAAPDDKSGPAFLPESLRNGTLTTVPGTDADGTTHDYIVQLSPMKEYHADLMILVAIPYNDIFGNIVSAQRKGVIVSVVVGIFGTLLVIVLSFLTVRPLTILGKAMTELTNFDFSILSTKKEELERGSIIKEINQLQRTFMIMVHAFAGAIKRNQSLVKGTGAGTGKTSTIGGNRPTNERSF